VRYHGSNKKPSNEMMIKNTNERLMKKTLKWNEGMYDDKQTVLKSETETVMMPRIVSQSLMAWSIFIRQVIFVQSIHLYLCNLT
jgi:hypothetical protein